MSADRRPRGGGAAGGGARGAEGAVRDPAAQPERTRMAWRRTTLAFAAVVALLARGTVHDGGPPRQYALAALGALVWLVFLALAHRRIRALDVPRPGPLGTRTAYAAAVCTLTVPISGMVVWLW
ncbi:hypothetical protein SUDANB106_01043 [Streptomyces sp. enrichment culture]|uniref:DUF202 domain-containing protein n=1 Tax=Streptomyces sp. enrichment culture TaxID=1795815 RepID=UPI00218B858F|nr:DUF202 domain-containing protein [Streptomyces radiopugnans]